MSDASITQPLPSEDQEVHKISGHGRHRGPVSQHDSDVAPRGRHRKPARQDAEAAA
ncbi:hypothetical protein [Streptomyces sp. NPDC018693]|uniref:hypothetical protein n=1 Tax=unclassified Streptomyces TaxID=2593676 RepID=UPI0037B33F0B